MPLGIFRPVIVEVMVNAVRGQVAVERAGRAAGDRAGEVETRGRRRPRI